MISMNGKESNVCYQLIFDLSIGYFFCSLPKFLVVLLSRFLVLDFFFHFKRGLIRVRIIPCGKKHCRFQDWNSVRGIVFTGLGQQNICYEWFTFL